jgi:hypothetical protein
LGDLALALEGRHANELMMFCWIIFGGVAEDLEVKEVYF